MTQKIVIMGVAGCGKTSVGEALAEAAGIGFIDGDALHPRSNVAKMSAGTPLTDDDRWPWLEAVGRSLAGANEGMAIGCSALKRVYRQRIREFAGGPVTFVHLAGSRAVIEQRMRLRINHFMPVALLDSQFATLEPPGADEDAITVDIDQTLEAIVAEIMDGLGLARRG